MTSGGISRRQAMLGATALAAGAMLPNLAIGGAVRAFALNPGPARRNLAGAGYPDTDVWTYDGRVPGPTIRLKQGEPARIAVRNGLAEPTTVHWHGIRLPNAMDGVPHLTQAPVEPGGTFVYEFTPPDAGTYWYHSHFNSAEQIGRGLYGPLIVEEPNPPDVDRDLVWVLDDWRLGKDGAIAGNFAHFMDLSHAGRIGNTVTINGERPETIIVRAGERIRLRLINAANARIFGLNFGPLTPVVIARDGHPVDPRAAENGRVMIAPAQRVDLILDMTGKPGDRIDVVDAYYGEKRRFRVVALAYGPTAALRDRPLAPPRRLAANPLPEPDIGRATRHKVVLDGGMHARMESAVLDGKTVDIRTLFRAGKMWAINGEVAGTDHSRHGPAFVAARRGETVVLEIENRSIWEHPMHLHGFAFRVLSRDGQAVPGRPWLDTILIGPEGKAEVAFVADAPGDWLFHCHVLEHHLAGMGAVLRVD